MTCDFCGSGRGVEIFEFPPDPPRRKCEVCARLVGTDGGTTARDVLRAVVSLFQALELLPHDSDDE